MKSFLLLRLPGERQPRSFEESDTTTDHCFHFVPFNREKHQPIQVMLRPAEAPREIPQPPGEFQSYQLYREDYLKLIADTRTAISANAWGKIVMSRVQKFSMKELNLKEVFESLCERYPRACVYVFYHPQCGMWIGATPELLLKREGELLQTMSLAGTRNLGQEESFTEKEEEEQAIVTSYIREMLSQEPALHSIKVSEREKMQAGNLVHFLNKIEARIAGNFDIAEFLARFHPTPAVGGVPKAEALQYILENENHDRAYYSGYFGLESPGKSQYFVNLRCMEVFENSVVLFAGGGITAISDPLSEWEETEAKMQTLLNVLNPEI